MSKPHSTIDSPIAPALPSRSPMSWFWKVVAVLYWLMIFAGTHYPKDPHPGTGMIDKWMHFTAFTGLSFLLSIALLRDGVLPFRTAIKIAMAAILYGIADELTQPFVGRDSEWMDWYFDIAGTLLGVTIVLVASRVWRWCTH
jgi:VanZ family protein